MKAPYTYTATVTSGSTFLSKVHDYVLLIKLRLSLMVVLSSVLGYLIASLGNTDYVTMSVLAVGGLFITAAANALNQVLEREFDCFMPRTMNRPVTTGRMKSSEAVMFAGITCLLGVGLLSSINTVTAFLGMLSMVTYAFVYTPLKRYSTLAVAIGAVPGALPVLIGTTAFEGQMTYLGISLFAMQFLWQFPHFWAIGFNSVEDYKKAGFKLIPSNNGEVDRSLGKNATVYSLLIIPVLIFMHYMSLIGLTSFLLLIVLTLFYSLFSLLFHLRFDKRSALKLMFFSFIYLPLFLLFILIF
ncbi:MAG: protoheme IX farnesyltransferase [Saprospiraceae bacterium]|nr:protoheme IX farnesyltransferase [Saprospiraceae bacterium]